MSDLVRYSVGGFDPANPHDFRMELHLRPLLNALQKIPTGPAMVYGVLVSLPMLLFINSDQNRQIALASEPGEWEWKHSLSMARFLSIKFHCTSALTKLELDLIRNYMTVVRSEMLEEIHPNAVESHLIDGMPMVQEYDNTVHVIESCKRELGGPPPCNEPGDNLEPAHYDFAAIYYTPSQLAEIDTNFLTCFQALRRS